MFTNSIFYALRRFSNIQPIIYITSSTPLTLNLAYNTSYCNDFEAPRRASSGDTLITINPYNPGHRPKPKVELYSETTSCPFLLGCNFKTVLKHQYTELKLDTKQHILRQSTGYVNRHQYIAWKGDADTTWRLTDTAGHYRSIRF